MIFAITPFLLFLALPCPSLSKPHSPRRTYYYKPYKSKLASTHYYKPSPTTETEYSFSKSHHPSSSKYYTKNPVISSKPGKPSRGTKYWKKSSKSGPRTRIYYTKPDTVDTPYSGTIFYRKHEDNKGITKEQSKSAVSSFLKKMRTYIGSYRSSKEGQSSNVGKSHVEKIVDDDVTRDALGRGKTSKEKPFFRKYEVVDSKFVDQEMNKKVSMNTKNSHLHFSELSIHHPSFHEFHDPAPQFMDQDLEKIHQNFAQQTETESYGATFKTSTDTEAPFTYTTAIPPTQTTTTKILSTIATTTHTTLASTTTTLSTITTTLKPNPDNPQIYFSKFHNGGNYAVQRPGKPLSLAASTSSVNKLQSDIIDESFDDQKINQANRPSTTESETRHSNFDTSEKLTETESNNDSEGVVAYLVSDSLTPGKEFLVTKEALIGSGVINNKVVSLTSYSGTGGGKVEILSDKTFNITGVWYRGAGSADWLVGTRFPIGHFSDSVLLAPLQGDQILVLPDQISMADISWLALYCQTCKEDKVVMQVYIPETFL